MSLDQLTSLTPPAQIIAGLALLLFGRNLFWLFVGIIGFSFGLQLGAGLFPSADASVVLIASLLLGLLCAILAIFLQKIAVVLAGAVAAGLMAMRFAAEAGLSEPLPILAFLVAAVVGAVLVSMLFDWALIILSSLFGASLVVQAVTLTSQFKLICLVALVALGIWVQAGFRSRRLATTSAA